MNGERQPNHWLRQARTMRGQTQQQVAEAISLLVGYPVEPVVAEELPLPRRVGAEEVEQVRVPAWIRRGRDGGSAAYRSRQL